MDLPHPTFDPQGMPRVNLSERFEEEQQGTETRAAPTTDTSPTAPLSVLPTPGTGAGTPTEQTATVEEQANLALASLQAAIRDSAALVRNPRRVVQSALSAYPGLSSALHVEPSEPEAEAEQSWVGTFTAELQRMVTAEAEQARRRRVQGHAPAMPDEAAYRRAWDDLLEVAHRLPSELTAEAGKRAYEVYEFLRLAWEENVLRILNTPQFGYTYVTEQCAEPQQRRTTLASNPLCASRTRPAPLAAGGWADWSSIEMRAREHRQMAGAPLSGKEWHSRAASQAAPAAAATATATPGAAVPAAATAPGSAATRGAQAPRTAGVTPVYTTPPQRQRCSPQGWRGRTSTRLGRSCSSTMTSTASAAPPASPWSHMLACARLAAASATAHTRRRSSRGARRRRWQGCRART